MNSTTKRLNAIDAIRGFSVVSMVLFHFCYDLVALAGIDLSWFKPPFEDVWRASISWTFLFVAGLMCSYSKSDFRRAARYGGLAFAIWIATTLAAVDTPISFGIIFCMAASTLLYAALQKHNAAPRGLVCGFVLFFSFVILLGIPRGTIGITGCELRLPKELYSTDLFSWLGFTGPHFTSGDYYPMLPYSLMYLAGSSFGPLLQKAKLPKWVYNLKLPVLNFIGRHPLEVYVLHQPILLMITSLVAGA